MSSSNEALKELIYVSLLCTHVHTNIRPQTLQFHGFACTWLLNNSLTAFTTSCSCCSIIDNARIWFTASAVIIQFSGIRFEKYYFCGMCMVAEFNSSDDMFGCSSFIFHVRAEWSGIPFWRSNLPKHPLFSNTVAILMFNSHLPKMSWTLQRHCCWNQRI